MLFPPILLALLLAYSDGLSNMNTILEHNTLYEIDDADAKYHTGFYNSTKVETNEESSTESSYRPSDVQLPEEVDWRLAGAVTKVKKGGRCGSGYAFTAIGALEAQYFLKFKKLVSLSVQNIVDCTYKRKKYNNWGCNGGRVDKTFQYIIDNQGINAEQSYPYNETRSRRCHFSANNTVARMSSYVNLPSGNETELQKAVALIGPVAVAVDNRHMRNYTGGIFNDPSCSSTYLTHNMLVVGYGKEVKDEYWIVKNSWGAEWGENGYVRMTRNKENQCGIATDALYPVV